MECWVTAGPTFEPLDRVRRLTNFSTGALGTALANHLAASGHAVRLLRGETATAPPPVAAVTVEPFATTDDLQALLRRGASDATVAIFHAAAVSDFACGSVSTRQADGSFRPVVGGKVTTREGALWLELRPTPKILPRLRDWFPRALLVGWKYEVDGTLSDALRRAREQLAEARSDACVLNGPVHGPGFSVVTHGGVEACPGRPQLFAALDRLLAGR